MSGLRTLIAATLLAGIAITGESVRAQANSPGSQGTDRQPEVYRPGGGVVLPQPLREVKPRYTADAMRQQIQGAVLLECVVETDGTVRQVQIVRSLDRRFGLDDEAMTAARQWRFRPGTKDGLPVRVLVTIELTFTLRDTPREIAPPTLPAAFSATGQSPATSNAEWEQKEVQAPPLTVSLQHPKGWVVAPGRADIPIAMQPPDGSYIVAMMSPAAAATTALEPTSRSELEKAARAVANTYKRPAVAFGQARVAGRLWFWFDMGVEEMNHLWVFASAIERQQVILTFFIHLTRGAQPGDWEAQRQGAGPTFLQILERMSFKRSK